jgi:F420-0:gamma-glutamyl ligase
MAASSAAPTRTNRDHDRDRHVQVTKSTETKSAFKTTEMIAYVVAVLGVLIAGAVIDESNAGGLGGKQVWLYVTILTVGYMVSRGLAKSGSRDSYTDDDR